MKIKRPKDYKDEPEENLSTNCPYCGKENAVLNCDCVLACRARKYCHLTGGEE